MLQKGEFNTLLVESLDEARETLETVNQDFLLYKTNKGYAISFAGQWSLDDKNKKTWEEEHDIKLPRNLAFSYYAYSNMQKGKEVIHTENARQGLEYAGICLPDKPALAYCEDNKLIIEKITFIVHQCYKCFKGIYALENTTKEEYNFSYLKDIKWKSFKKYIESM